MKTIKTLEGQLEEVTTQQSAKLKAERSKSAKIQEVQEKAAEEQSETIKKQRESLVQQQETINKL